ncbi:MAG: dTMP kinase [Blastochloris sp.]|nr:dTMP kinase [Blastochloris sp.]
MKPRFISFEGSEGCGKSTQIALLSSWLKQRQHQVHSFREPGGTPLGECLRDLLKHHPAGLGMEAESELLLFAASRAELVRKMILPRLQENCWVLCDRFLDSTTIYQGLGRRLDPLVVETLNRFAIGDTLPTLTLLLDLDPEEAYARQQQRATQRSASEPGDRMESEPKTFYQAVVQGYRVLAEQEPQRIKRIPAQGSREDVFQLVLKEVNHAFPGLMD